VRKLISPLKRLARKFNLAVVLIHHVNKKEDLTRARSRVMGSAAFINTPRSVNLLADDPDDDLGRKILVQTKANLSGRPLAVAFVRGAKKMKYNLGRATTLNRPRNRRAVENSDPPPAFEGDPMRHYVMIETSDDMYGHRFNSLRELTEILALSARPGHWAAPVLAAHPAARYMVGHVRMMHMVLLAVLCAPCPRRSMHDDAIVC